MSPRDGKTRRLAPACQLVCAASGAVAMTLLGCPGVQPGGGGHADFNNLTDATNRNATYIGSSACSACHAALHPDIVAAHAAHGHAHVLNRIQNGPPEYPAAGTRAGVPEPPPGRSWSDVVYVIGGYLKGARFIDQAGNLMTTGLLGVPTQWALVMPPNGNTPSFVPYEAARTTPQPFEFSCFRCHVTGAAAPNPDHPQFQENRPGMAGTWAEPSVTCEACHGPGSNHPANPSARDMYVGSAAFNCGRCHSSGPDPTVILATGGFVSHGQQWSELLASGGHKDFACTICHDPHASVGYGGGIRNRCAGCHADMTLGIHKGVVFVRGDYVEPVDCESCHMPYATEVASVGQPDTVGPIARVGDTRTHIFRIATTNTDYTGFFTSDGTQVVKDASGRAAVTVDFVCLRCHNDVGNAFALTVKGASGLTLRVHAPLPR